METFFSNILVQLVIFYTRFIDILFPSMFLFAKPKRIMMAAFYPMVYLFIYAAGLPNWS